MAEILARLAFAESLLKRFSLNFFRQMKKTKKSGAGPVVL